jgi:proteasome lid subunit RPN8/RPN11
MSDSPAGDILEWRDLPYMSSDEDHHATASLVKLLPAALAAIQVHLSSDITMEQVGLLFGHVEETAYEPSIVTILTSHPLDPASASSTHVAMLRDQWPSAWRRLTSCKPDQQLVGWYHSHPGHGISSRPPIFAPRPCGFVSHGTSHWSSTRSLIPLAHSAARRVKGHQSSLQKLIDMQITMPLVTCFDNLR